MTKRSYDHSTVSRHKPTTDIRGQLKQLLQQTRPIEQVIAMNDPTGGQVSGLSTQQQAIAAFTERYIAAFNSERPNAIEALVREHAEPVAIGSVMICSDGVAVFHLPNHPVVPATPGVYVNDFSAYSMDRVCSQLHRGFFRVFPSPTIGERFSLNQSPPPDAELIQGLSGTLLNHSMLKYLVEDVRTFDRVELAAMGYTPMVDVRDGVVTSQVPGRRTLWSPIVTWPDGTSTRQFAWVKVDLWFGIEELDIGLLDPSNNAHLDWLAFATVRSSGTIFNGAEASKDVAEHASDLLEEFCVEFDRLLESSGNDEEVLHKWLNDPKHHVFLDSRHRRVRSKVAFGSHVSDFVIERSDGTYALVEIERASEPLFTRSGQEPSSALNHAIQQVRDWQRYIRENMLTVRNELGLPNIYEPEGMVIMGRSEHIAPKLGATRWRDLKATSNVQLATYDDILESVRTLASILRCKVTR